MPLSHGFNDVPILPAYCLLALRNLICFGCGNAAWHVHMAVDVVPSWWRGDYFRDIGTTSIQMDSLSPL